MLASARGRPWEPVSERKTMGASARGRPWEPRSERKTMGASEREEDHGSQWARGRPCEPAREEDHGREEDHADQHEGKTMLASARGRPWEPVSERKTMGASEREEDHGSQWARGRSCWPVRDISLYICCQIFITCTYYIYLCYIFITCTYYIYIYYMYICHHIIIMSLLNKQKKL